MLDVRSWFTSSQRNFAMASVEPLTSKTSPWARRLQIEASERSRFHGLAANRPEAEEVPLLCAGACAAVAAEKAALDQLSNAARRQHARVRRAQSNERYVHILASTLQEASHGAVKVTRVPLDNSALKACFSEVGAKAAELRLLTAFQIHHQQLSDAWEALVRDAGRPAVRTRATLLRLECVPHALVHGLPPLLVIEAPAWLRVQTAGSNAWIDPPVEHGSGGTTERAFPPRGESSVAALLRRSPKPPAPHFFASQAASQDFHAHLKAAAAALDAADAAEDGSEPPQSATPQKTRRTEAEAEADKENARTRARAALAAASLAGPEARPAVTAEMVGGVSDDDEWDSAEAEGAEVAPCLWLLLCRVIGAGQQLTSGGGAESLAAVEASSLPLFLVQLDGSGRSAGGAGHGAVDARVRVNGVDVGASSARAAAEPPSTKRGAKGGGGGGGGGGGAPAAPSSTSAPPVALLDTPEWRAWQQAHTDAEARAAAARQRVADAQRSTRNAHAPARARALGEQAQREAELQRLLAEARRELTDLKKSNHTLDVELHNAMLATPRGSGSG